MIMPWCKRVEWKLVIVVSWPPCWVAVDVKTLPTLPINDPLARGVLFGLTLTHTRGLWVGAGTAGTPNHPAAWVSTDLTNWQAMPASLDGTPGGTLSIIGALGTKIVLLGTAPELDRFYTLETPRR